MQSNLSMIKKEANYFLLFLGDGDTTYRTPLLNILVSGRKFLLQFLKLFIVEVIYLMEEKEM